MIKLLWHGRTYICLNMYNSLDNMANFCSDFLKILSFSFSILIILLTTSAQNAYGCYTSIFAFGDSLTDTGNYVNFYPQIFPGSQTLTRFGLSPYGETYFHHPTGRCSDGRLIIDFIAEYYGLPLVPPYFRGVKVNQSNSNFDAGVNFAVLGAPALPVALHEERGIHYASSNVSMGIQLGWFKELLPYLCNSSSSVELFQRSLFLMGPFGGNDYGHAIFQGRSLDEVKSFVPLVMNAISSAIEELIQLGAKNIMVPGLFPDGCLPMSLTQFEGSNKEDYDPETGCLNWLNNISEHHNKRLQEVLNQIRQNHPDAVIIYADYFNAIMPFYHSPQQFGFEGRSLRACCGVGGHYNFNFTAQCGESPSTSCADPYSYISWDGTHFTEAAYRLVAQGLLEGPHTIPHIRSTCIISTIMDWPLVIS